MPWGDQDWDMDEPHTQAERNRRSRSAWGVVIYCALAIGGVSVMLLGMCGGAVPR